MRYELKIVNTMDKMACLVKSSKLTFRLALEKCM